MIKTIINKVLKATLSELFVNAPSVQLSMGADMFSDSNINLSNLAFRPDIFDVVLQPLKLVSGHLGNLKVEGIAELALGGKLKFQAENIFLLFNIDTTSDAEYMQSLKKILIELQSDTFPVVLIRELMKRIQGFPVGPEPDLKKKRKVMYKALDYVCKGLHGLLKNIHIRIEIPQNGASPTEAAAHSAFGFIIPQIKFAPSVSGSRPDGVSKMDPLVLLSLRSLQLYSDYDRDSYCIKGSTDAAVAKQFLDRWTTEVHTSLVLPFDVDITLAIGVRRKIGLLSPKVSCKVPLLRIVFDQRQLQVLRDLTQMLAYATKRSQQLVRVQKIFRKGFPLPRMYEVGGIRLLPHLVIRNKAYPADTTLPPTNTSGLVAFMKERVGDRWPTMLWKHLIRLVVSDLKLNRPLGKWWELAKLAQIRRDYAFTYSRLLKRSKDTGHFSFDVNAKIPSDKLRQLFEYEMYLPVKAVMMFRCLAVMIATAELFNAKRKKTKQQSTQLSGSGTSGQQTSKQPFEKTSMKYLDVLRIFVELFEVQRDTVIRRFDRHGAEDDDFDGDDASTIRDSEFGNTNHGSSSSNVLRPSRASLYAGELTSPAPPSNASVGSQNSTSRTPKASAGSSIANIFKSPTASNSNGGGGGGGALNSMKNSVKTVVSLPNSALKMLSGGMGGGSNHAVDEYDNKLMGTFDLSVFGDFLGGLLPSDEGGKGSENSPNERGSTGLESAPGITSADGSVSKEVFDYQLPGEPPALHVIAESVLWILQRHQDVLTVMLPDFNLTTDKITADLRTPLLMPNGERKNVISCAAAGFSFNVNISQSSQIESPGGKAGKDDSSARKISSLSGALVQVRLVTKQIAAILHLESNPDGENAASAALAPNNKGKGTLLTSGLPAYPAAEEAAGGSESSQDGEGKALYDEERDDVTVSDTSSVRNSTTSSVRGMEAAAATAKTPAKPAGGPPPVPPKPFAAIAGETVMQTMKRKQQYEAELNAYNASIASPAPAKNPPAGGNSFKTPVGKSILVDEIKLNPSAPAVSAALPSSTSPFEREVLVSSKSENALVMCLILDMDEKGEGAADIQVQVGGMAIDASKTVLSNVIRPRVTGNVKAVLGAYAQMMQYLPLLSEPALVIDREHNVPAVVLVKSKNEVQSGTMAAVEVAAPAVEQQKPSEVDIEKEYLKQFAAVAVGEVTGEESSSGGADDRDDEDEPGSAAQSVEELQKAVLHEGDKPKPPPAAPAPAVTKSAPSAEKSAAFAQELAQRRAMIENKNIQQWIGITEAHMPKILSICVRTSALNVQLLEASVLKDLIFSKIHNVIDIAAGRDRHSASLTFATDHLLGMLGNILMGGNATFNPFSGGVRKWGSKFASHRNSSHKSVVSDLKSTLVIPSTELVIAKATVPYPSLDVHFQGFELKVPMTDETICHLAAVLLAEFMPFFY